MKCSYTKESGFTLVELMVSLAIFTIVVTMATSAVLVIFESNRKTAAISLAVDNANFALDAMQREIRYGRNFSCPEDPCTRLTFDNADGVEIIYDFANNATTRKEGLDPALPLTAETYTVNDLRFKLASDNKAVSIFIKGEVQFGSQSGEFNLQTSVSSRQF